MSGCLKVCTMHKVSKILLEIASIGWIVFVVIAIIMTLSSCGTTSDSVMKYGVSPKYMLFEECMYKNQKWEDTN